MHTFTFHFWQLSLFKERSSLFCIDRKSNRAQFKICPLTKQNRRPILRRIPISEKGENLLCESYFRLFWGQRIEWLKYSFFQMAQQQVVINGTMVVGPAEVQVQVRLFDEYNCHRCDYKFEIYCCVKATYYERFSHFRRFKTWMTRFKTWMWRFSSRGPTTLR